jgi:hypothetical protein
MLPPTGTQQKSLILPIVRNNARRRVRHLLQIPIAIVTIGLWSLYFNVTITPQLSIDEVDDESVVNIKDDIVQGFESDQNLSAIVLPDCIRNKVICRYDDIGDFLENENPALIHEPLPSVPLSRRIPHSKANNNTYILEQRAVLPEDGSMTALMDYNTMLIPLYKNVKHDNGTYSLESDIHPVLLDRLTGRYHPYFNDTEADRVKYLSVTRTSNLHSCKPKFKFHFGTLPQDFLGLSLLDENLLRIQGTDVAINVDKWLLGNLTAYFHDFQIIAAKVTKDASFTYKDQLFLIPSGHIGTFAFPIDIRRVPPATKSSGFEYIPFDTKFEATSVPFSREFMYGDGIEVRIAADTAGLKEKPPHVRGDHLFMRGHGVDRGKNLHFFESSNGQTYMELWPHDSHRTVPVDFLMNETKLSAMNLFPHSKIVHMKGKRPGVQFDNMIDSRDNNHDSQWSFQSITPKHEVRVQLLCLCISYFDNLFQYYTYCIVIHTGLHNMVIIGSDHK